jgi:exosome complex RNA-binding protein Rrp42 (RNase PH superfamily)
MSFINPFITVPTNEAKAIRKVRNTKRPAISTPKTESTYSTAKTYQEEVRKLLQQNIIGDGST